MSNNQSIQILRGTRQAIYDNRTVDLLAGQPLYNTDDNYLTIGDGSKKIGDLPIVVREVRGYFGDRNGITEMTPAGSWYFGQGSSSTGFGSTGLYANNTSLEIKSKPTSAPFSQAVVSDVTVSAEGWVGSASTPLAFLQLRRSATSTYASLRANGTVSVGTFTSYNGADIPYSELQMYSSNATLTINSKKALTRNILYNSSDVEIGDSIDLMNGEPKDGSGNAQPNAQISLKRDSSGSSDAYSIDLIANDKVNLLVGAGNAAHTVVFDGSGMTIGSDAFNSPKKITGLATKATTAANLNTYEGGAASGTKNVSVSFANAGTMTVKAGGVTSDSVDVIAKKISINNTPNAVVVQHAVPSSPADNTIYLIY